MGAIERGTVAGSQGLHELPADWSWTRLGDVCDAINGRGFKSTEWRESGLPIIRIQNLKDSNAAFNYFDSALDDRHRVRPGDLLFAWSGTPGTSFGAHIWKGPDAALNQHLFNIRFDSRRLDAKYFCLALNQNVSRYVAQAQGGVGLAHITKSKFLDSFIPIAPMAKQLALVAEIEKQFSRLDEAVANLKRVKANLKRYKAAVLHSVTAGQFDGEGSTAPASESNRWRWLTIAELASSDPRSIQSGPFGSNLLHSEFQSTGKLVIGIDNVQDGEFSIGSNHRISESKFAELERYRARPKDVLITVMATVGRVCVVPQEVEPAVITKHVYRISVDRSIALPDYVGIALRGARDVRAQLLGSVQGQTRPGLNGGLIKRIRVPVPPLAEQYRIVAEVDRRLSIIREVEAEVDANLKRAQALRQATLSKAFGSTAQ